MITAIIVFLIGLGCYLVGRKAVQDRTIRQILQIVGIIVMVIGGIYFVLAVVPVTAEVETTKGIVNHG